MKREIFACDICETEGDVVTTELQVIFITEQTEGRATDPYLEIEKLDICKSCLDKILQGNYVYAHGAQGYNHYYFKKT